MSSCTCYDCFPASVLGTLGCSWYDAVSVWYVWTICDYMQLKLQVGSMCPEGTYWYDNVQDFKKLNLSREKNYDFFFPALFKCIKWAFSVYLGEMEALHLVYQNVLCLIPLEERDYYLFFLLLKLLPLLCTKPLSCCPLYYFHCCM